MSYFLYRSVLGLYTNGVFCRVFFKVLECCSHLAQHSAAGTSQPAGVALVTLLSGGGADTETSREFSPQGLAQSAGKHSITFVLFFRVVLKVMMNFLNVIVMSLAITII